jgi:hypothetical protein
MTTPSNPPLTTAFATGASTSPEHAPSPSPEHASSPGAAPHGPPSSFTDYVMKFAGDNPIATALSTASMALSAYHGYKRNDSVGWALVWGLLGGTFPVITPVIAVAQGFGQEKYKQVQLAALGTNEFTECLPPHIRALCVAEGDHHGR